MEFESLAGYRLGHLDSKKPGIILREQRVTKNMTQAQVANKAGITLQQYQKFESDARNIRTASFQLACRVLKALNMDIEQFFDGAYSIGEEIYCENGKLKYAKTGRAVTSDVTQEVKEESI